MTERNVASAFAEAEREGAVLVLDEADSFLQDRRRADRHWQVVSFRRARVMRRRDYAAASTASLSFG